MEKFDVLIIGGGAAGMSSALLLGSAKSKPFAKDKKIGIIMHQKASALSSALFNNVLGIKAGTTGKEILESGKKQLKETYPHILQIEKEKVIKVEENDNEVVVTTNKNIYAANNIIVAVGPANTFNVEGLTQYVEPHKKLPAEKNRIQLKNNNQQVTGKIYVAGVLAGHVSQLPIAMGSGADVAADILRKWNNNKPAMVHDSIG
jgi:thioredoxin reductase